MDKTNSTIKLVCIVILALLVVFVPGAGEAISGMLGGSEDFQPIYVDIGNFNLKWDIAFEFPTFQIDAELNPTLNISTPFIILVALFTLVVIVVSYFSYWSTLVATIIFGGLGLYLSGQVADVYRYLTSNGNTSWEASGSCFWILFSIFLIVMAMGIFDLSSMIFIRKHNFDPFSSAIFGVLIALLVSTVGSFIVSGLCWLTLGLGWSGGIYLFLGIAFGIAMIGEFVVINWIRSEVDDSEYDESDDYYDEDYE